jgi:hypothetical protein
LKDCCGFHYIQLDPVADMAVDNQDVRRATDADIEQIDKLRRPTQDRGLGIYFG